MDEVEKLHISEKEWHMLNMIRGLDQDLLYMVIAAEESDDGYVLTGSYEKFVKLRHDMYMELELKPRSRVVHSLLTKIDGLSGEFS